MRVLRGKNWKTHHNAFTLLKERKKRVFFIFSCSRVVFFILQSGRTLLKFHKSNQNMLNSLISLLTPSSFGTIRFNARTSTILIYSSQQPNSFCFRHIFTLIFLLVKPRRSKAQTIRIFFSNFNQLYWIFFIFFVRLSYYFVLCFIHTSIVKGTQLSTRS